MLYQSWVSFFSEHLYSSNPLSFLLTVLNLIIQFFSPFFPGRGNASAMLQWANEQLIYTTTNEMDYSADEPIIANFTISRHADGFRTMLKAYT